MRLDLKSLTELYVDYNKIRWREHAGGNDIYRATHGAKLFIASKPWLRGTKRQLTFLTTERLFSLVADEALREVGKPPLAVDFTHIPGVPLWRDPRAAAYRSADDRRVSELTQEILDADANAVVITDGIKNTLDAVYRSRVLTFQAAKGRNGLETNNIYVIVTCPAPAVFQRLTLWGSGLAGMMLLRRSIRTRSIKPLAGTAASDTGATASQL